MTFAEVDAATIAIELDDFGEASSPRRPPEVDGPTGLRAVAGVWAIAESRPRPRSTHLRGRRRYGAQAQQPVDEALGLFDDWKGAQP